MVQEPQFGLLGPLLVRRDDMVVPVAAGKQRVLVAALLLNQGSAMTPEELAEMLWPSGPPPSSQVTVSGGRVVSGGGALQVASCPGATDVTVTVAPGSGTEDSC